MPIILTDEDKKKIITYANRILYSYKNGVGPYCVGSSKSKCISAGELHELLFYFESISNGNGMNTNFRVDVKITSTDIGFCITYNFVKDDEKEFLLQIGSCETFLNPITKCNDCKNLYSSSGSVNGCRIFPKDEIFIKEIVTALNNHSIRPVNGDVDLFCLYGLRKIALLRWLLMCIKRLSDTDGNNQMVTGAEVWRKLYSSFKKILEKLNTEDPNSNNGSIMLVALNKNRIKVNQDAGGFNKQYTDVFKRFEDLCNSIKDDDILVAADKISVLWENVKGYIR